MTKPYKPVGGRVAPYDLQFVDSLCNIKLRLTMDTPAAPGGLLEHAILAVKALVQLWTPRSIVLCTEQYEYDAPSNEEVEYTRLPDLHPSHLADIPNQIRESLPNPPKGHVGPWGFSRLTLWHDGWFRLVIPDGVHAPEGLDVMNDDGLLGWSYDWLPAVEVSGHRSAWIHLHEASSQFGFTIDVWDTSAIDLSFTYGSDLHHEFSIARTRDVVLGAPVTEWRRLNHGLVNAVLAELRELGWEKQWPKG